MTVMSSETWEPVQSELHQVGVYNFHCSARIRHFSVLQLLQQSQSPDTQIQRAVQQSLDELSQHPQFCNYLVLILARLTDQDDATRSLSGLILKNTVRTMWPILPEQVRTFVKTQSLVAIGDKSPLIKATVGILVTNIVLQGGVISWPNLLPDLCQMLDSSDPAIAEGAIGALQKICEDSADTLSQEASAPMDSLIPKLLHFFSAPAPKLRALAVNCINCCLMVQCEGVNKYIDIFLAQLFSLANDVDQDVQRQLCRSLTLLLDCHLDKLTPQLAAIVEFMLMRTQDQDEQTALEACEFWLALSEYPPLVKQTLTGHLDKLIPLLVHSMKYSEMDIVLLKADVEEDSMVPDRQEDIRPRFHKAKTRMQKHQNAEVGENDEDEDLIDGSVTEWNLRKCSAASLDVLSGIFGDEFLPTLLPILKETLFHHQWEIKESAILALGAVAEGCCSGMTLHLPQLIPYLISCLRDRNTLVRSITCWTLSRYCHYVIEQPHEVHFKLLMTELLARILDPNKRVQEAACSAFATLEEEACMELVPYLPQILTTLVAAFEQYQAKNLLILYDAIGTLADSVSHYLNSPEYVSMLMPPLIEKWLQLHDDDKEFFPLLECLSSMATALQSGFLPYCKPVFQRCIVIIQRNLQLTAAALEKPGELEVPEKDFLIVALDLLSGLVEGLSTHIEPLISESNIILLMFQCAQDSTPEVRQSSFALLGDLAKACYQHVHSYTGSLLPILANNLDPELVSVCNNSIWAVGEITVKMGVEMRQYVGTLLPSLVSIMNREKTPKTLLENTGASNGGDSNDSDLEKEMIK